jgi:hypothetical protein
MEHKGLCCGQEWPVYETLLNAEGYCACHGRRTKSLDVKYFLRRPISFMPPLGPPKATPREHVLAQWRGVDLTPLEVAGRPAKSTADVMKQVLRDVRIECRQQEAEIVKVWNQLMPPDIVAHAQPVNVAKGTLFVNVDSSAWLSEIVRWRKKEILERLQHSFGRKLIVRISFRLG